jgi:hypothetical protein
MHLGDCHNFHDFRRLAKRRVPGPIFDYTRLLALRTNALIAASDRSSNGRSGRDVGFSPFGACSFHGVSSVLLAMEFSRVRNVRELNNFVHTLYAVIHRYLNNRIVFLDC